MSEEFIKKAKEAKPYALICKGTRMDAESEDPDPEGRSSGTHSAAKESEHNFTEKEVGERVSGIVSESRGLVFGYFSMSNINRFMSFYRAALKNKRKLVIDTKLAYVIAEMRGKIPVLPDPVKDRNIRVYYRLDKSCTFAQKDYSVWEREFMGNMVTFEEIKKSPEEYVMHLNFNRLIELVYLQPKDADFIYSSSEHFLEGEGNEEEKKRWEAWMKHFGIKFHKAHCSGHASKKDLEYVIKEINPEVLIPVHTNVPEAFKEFHKNVRIPEKGKTLIL